MFFELSPISVPLLYGYLIIASIKNSVKKNNLSGQTLVSYAYFTTVIHFLVILYTYPHEGIFIILFLMLYTHAFLFLLKITNKYLTNDKEKLLILCETCGNYVSNYIYFIILCATYMIIYNILAYFIFEKFVVALFTSICMNIIIYFVFF